MRGFEVVSTFKKNNINIPKRATKFSAGYDIQVIEDYIVKPQEIYLAPTGLKAFMGDDEVLMLYPRSSLAVKRKLTIPNNVGVIDKDYYNNQNNEGHIFVALYNFSNENVELKKGERIAQGIFQKYLTTNDDESISSVRSGGFGSTN